MGFRVFVFPLATRQRCRDQMSCAGRQLFLLNNFTPDKVAEAHERTYQEVLYTKPMKERPQQQKAGSKSVIRANAVMRKL